MTDDATSDASPPVKRPREPAPRRAIVAWCLYDFANSTFSAVIVATVFAAWYTGTVVGNEDGRGDVWWGAVAIPISTLAVAITAPIMGAIADLSGARRLLFATYTFAAVAATTLFTTIEPGDVVWGAALFILANFAMEGAVVFYNAYLPELVPPERIGRVSGWGFGVGYVGSMLGLVLAGRILESSLPGELKIDLVWVLVAVLFGGFSLPALLILGRGRTRLMGVVEAAGHGVRHVREIARDALKRPPMRRFLLAYFLYINGVNTAIVFAGPFASKQFGFEGGDLVTLFLVVQLSALVGAVGLSWATDVLGPKRIVRFSLVLWLLTVGIFVFATSRPVFWVAAVVAGLGLGSVQAASRAFMAGLIPTGREDEFFGFYALCGKTSAPLGAVVFAMTSWLTGGNQRVAVAVIALFFIAGFVLLGRVAGGGPARRRREA